jgi:hypothetical protein
MVSRRSGKNWAISIHADILLVRFIYHADCDDHPPGISRFLAGFTSGVVRSSISRFRHLGGSPMVRCMMARVDTAILGWSGVLLRSGAADLFLNLDRNGNSARDWSINPNLCFTVDAGMPC